MDGSTLLVDAYTRFGITVLLLVMNAQLTDSERAALQQAVSKAFYDSVGFVEGTHGEVTRNGQVFFNVGFTTAIRQILGER